MKVMLLMRSDGSYAGGDATEDYAAWAGYEALLKKDGVLVESAQFADATGDISIGTDLTAAAKDGGASSSSEMEEVSTLVGYYVLDCSDRDDAIQYARRAPLYGSVEVRELAQH